MADEILRKLHKSVNDRSRMALIRQIHALKREDASFKTKMDEIIKSQPATEKRRETNLKFMNERRENLRRNQIGQMIQTLRENNPDLMLAFERIVNAKRIEDQYPEYIGKDKESKITKKYFINKFINIHSFSIYREEKELIRFSGRDQKICSADRQITAKDIREVVYTSVRPALCHHKIFW